MKQEVPNKNSKKKKRVLYKRPDSSLKVHNDIRDAVPQVLDVKYTHEW